jgi:hypothetical protein
MKTFCTMLFGLLLVAITQVAPAQTRPTASQTLDFWITNTEKEVVSVADAMPEENIPSHQPRANSLACARLPSR